MIDRHPATWDLAPWVHREGPDGWCAHVDIHDRPAERVSALLGPDGEPLLVPYPRPMLGFDLRPRNARQEAT